MKQTLFKRIIIFLLIAILTLLIVSIILVSENFANITDYNHCVLDSSSIALSSKDVVCSTVNANSTICLYLSLNDYADLNKKFIVNAFSNGTGYLLLRLYSPIGKLKSIDWVINCNQAAELRLFLPEFGDWKLQVTSYISSAPVYVTSRWE